MKKNEKMEKMRKYEEDENVDDDIYPVMKCFQVIKERSYLVINFFVVKSKVVRVVKKVKRSGSL